MRLILPFPCNSIDLGGERSIFKPGKINNSGRAYLNPLAKLGLPIIPITDSLYGAAITYLFLLFVNSTEDYDSLIINLETTTITCSQRAEEQPPLEPISISQEQSSLRHLIVGFSDNVEERRTGKGPVFSWTRRPSQSLIFRKSLS